MVSITQIIGKIKSFSIPGQATNLNKFKGVLHSQPLRDELVSTNKLLENVREACIPKGVISKYFGSQNFFNSVDQEVNDALLMGKTGKPLTWIPRWKPENWSEYANNAILDFEKTFPNSKKGQLALWIKFYTALAETKKPPLLYIINNISKLMKELNFPNIHEDLIKKNYL